MGKLMESESPGKHWCHEIRALLYWNQRETVCAVFSRVSLFIPSAVMRTLFSSIRISGLNHLPLKRLLNGPRSLHQA